MIISLPLSASIRVRRRLLFLCLVAGCTRPPADAPPAAAAKAPAGPPVVALVKPERRSLQRAVEQPGAIEPFARTPVLARVAGYVKEVHADIGDRVNAGKLLAELHVPELEEDVKQKRAAVAQSAAEVEQAKKLLAAAEAHVRSATAAVAEAAAGRARVLANYDRWKSEAERVAGLVERRVIDEQTRDETRNQFRAAEAARAEVEAKVRSAEAAQAESEAKRDKAKADIVVAEAKGRVAEAEEGRAAAMLGYAKLTAPFDGVITDRNVDVGHLLQPNSAAAPLFVVTRIDPVRIFVEVPEADAAWVRDGAAARVRVQAVRGREFTGTVARTGWALESKARTLRAAIDLPNPDGLLRPGMYAYATVTIVPPEAWTLPATAVVKQSDATVAFAVKDGKAVRVPVQLGAADATRVELLKWHGPRGWEDPTGTEAFVQKAAGLADGQAVTFGP